MSGAAGELLVGIAAGTALSEGAGASLVSGDGTGASAGTRTGAGAGAGDVQSQHIIAGMGLGAGALMPAATSIFPIR